MVIITFRKYKCKDCDRQFSERSLSPFVRHRYPDYVIKNSILYGLFVSTRITVFLAHESMNVDFSHQTAYNWSKKFAKIVSKLERVRNFSDIWHIDEKFVKVKGSKDDFAYLWDIIDDNNNIIATHVFNARDKASAIKILEKAKSKAIRPPNIIVTDGLQAYKKACKKVFGRKTKHIAAHFESKGIMYKGKLYYLSNNRIESLNSKINLWYKKFRGFKRLETANLWCEMFAYFYNYIRPRVIKHKIKY